MTLRQNNSRLFSDACRVGLRLLATRLCRVRLGAFFLAGLMSCPATYGEDDIPRWTRVVEHAAWQPRDSCGEAIFQDRLWLLGGWFDSFSEPPRDVWRSADGEHWERTAAQAPWRHSDLPTSLVYHNRLWMMGGWHNGRLPDASAGSEVWSTADGVQWQRATQSAPWPARLGAAGTVFQGRMWLLGGAKRYYDGDAQSLLHDAWHSEDGQSWQAAGEAPWAPRAYHAALVHDDKLWILGGGNYQPEYQARNDVWSSTDGKHWECRTAGAPWPVRIWFGAAVWRGQMWVFGGWSNHPFQNHGDLWYSSDGRAWRRLEVPGGPGPRHEHSLLIWRDALWVIGGHGMPLANDVWRLDLPANWQPQPPAAN